MGSTSCTFMTQFCIYHTVVMFDSFGPFKQFIALSYLLVPPH